MCKKIAREVDYKNTVAIRVTKTFTYKVDGLSNNEAWDIVFRPDVREAVAIECEGLDYEIETINIEAYEVEEI